MVLALASAPGAAQASRIAVDGPLLRLSDLAGAIGADAELGPAPAPGQRRSISLGAVLARLRAQRVTAPLGLRGPWIVETRSQRLSCARFSKMVRLELARNLARGLAVEEVDCRVPLLLPAGPLTMQARISDQGRRAGRLYAEVRVQVGRWPVRQVVVPVVVDGMIEVLIAAQELRPRTPLSSAVVQKVLRKASEVPADAFVSTQEIERWFPQTTLHKGELLRRAALKPVPLVRRGSRVVVAVRLPGLQLTSLGEVRQEGQKGDVVAVLCLSSRKLLRARVISARRVEVDL